MNVIDFILVFISLAFFFYGINCLFSKKMISEFNRFGLSKQRVLTGILQIIGATGLILGYYVQSNIIVIIGAIGLSLLMFLGFLVRIKIKDSFIESLPALTFALINLYIFIVYFQRI